jgi:hypothetical protein
MTTTTIERKKGRLRLILIGALALGSSSATLGGALTVLMAQQPAATSA